MVTIFMISAKKTSLSSLRVKLFWSKGNVVIISVYSVINKILSNYIDSNYILNVAMWPEFGNSSTSIIPSLDSISIIFNRFYSFSFSSNFIFIVLIFWCFTKFSFHHKWNEAPLLVINMVYTGCLTSCRTS